MLDASSVGWLMWDDQVSLWPTAHVRRALTSTLSVDWFQ